MVSNYVDADNRLPLTGLSAKRRERLAANKSFKWEPCLMRMFHADRGYLEHYL